EMVKVYNIPEEWDEKDLPWLAIIKEAVQNQFEAVEAEMKKAKQLVLESDGPYHYADALDADEALLQEAFRQLDNWDELQAFMQTVSFSKLSSKRIECNEDKKEQVKTLRNSYKKRLTDMGTKWFSRDLEHHVQDMRDMLPIMEQLVVLVKQFKERFALKKKEKAIVDFSDLEHFALALLMEESENEDIKASYVAKQLQALYSEL